MALAPGSKLGPYEIIAPIGRGGMGEVYRALDPRLNREVAIKICAERFGSQFDARFEREAPRCGRTQPHEHLHPP